MADGFSPAPAPEKTYAARLASEEAFYRDCEDVHRLPEIFHYWSNRYIKPKLQKFGFNSPDDVIRKSILEHCQSRDGARIVSIGSGNCELEVELAGQLRAAQCRNFAIDCLELNPAMLERGRTAAGLAGVIDHLNFVQTDLNRWTPSCSYDAALANQSLHHVVNLEGLFHGLTTALDPGSPFVISDMIGRNGHQRWPEALRIVQEFWRQLPPSHRFNHKLNRYEENFENRDFSHDSFEGIRAQDILPLLRSFFGFDVFLAFANVIDPFVDSSIGDNFDATSDWDRSFIDRVHARDEEEQLAGRIKPTHMLAIVRPQWSGRIRHLSPFTPEFCERRTSVSEPEELTADPAGVQSAYDWQSSPHSTERELEIACSRLKQLSHRIGELETVVEERTAWALRLDGEIAERNALVVQLQAEVESRNGWGKSLDAELAERTAWAQQLYQELEQVNAEFTRLLQNHADVHREFENRTAWALDLARQLEERTAWALRLQEELAAGTVQLQGAQQELERLTWARALDRSFHNILHAGFQIARRLRDGLRGR